MPIFDSTEIEYKVSFVGPSMTASISLCIHVANGGDSLKDHKQRFFFFFNDVEQISGKELSITMPMSLKTNHHALEKKMNPDLGN